MAAEFEQFMGESEGVLWTLERDSTLRSTMAAVVLLDRAPDWDAFLDRVDAASRAVPRLRQRVVAAPFHVAPPRWVAAERFELTDHVHRVVAPPGSGLETVVEFARSTALTGLDHTRPLWDFTLVEGLADGRAALIQKLHQAVTDGVAGARLVEALYGTEPDAGPAAEVADARPTEQSLALPLLLADALVHTSKAMVRAGSGAARATGSAAWSAVRHPLRSARGAVGVVSSAATVMAPVRDTLSPVMRRRGNSWRYFTIELPLEHVRQAAHTAGVSVNDWFLAGIADGFRRYHDRHDAPTRALRINMPYDPEGRTDRIGGNWITPMRLTIPIEIGDPFERMHAVREGFRRWRDQPALPLGEVAATVLDHLPSFVTTWWFASMLKHIDCLSTNVPGFPGAQYLADSRVERIYAFPPMLGSAVTVSLISHGDAACIGVTTDNLAVPDGDVLVECLREGWEELLEPSAPPT
ncbi:MAG: wax ester/triacylglycerol synthase family O-acyltransferase [Acidimicrobiia bacterium]